MNKANDAPIGTELGRGIVVEPLLGKPNKYYNTYCIRLHPAMSKQFNIDPGRQCILTAHRRDCVPLEGLVTKKDALDDESLQMCEGLSATTTELSGEVEQSRARIRVIAAVVEDEQIESNRVQIDETLRTALGIPMDEQRVTGAFEIRISSAPPNPPIEWLCRLFGYRHLYARIATGFVADIDKPIGRIPAFAFPLLGVPDGGRVICEVAEKRGEHYFLKRMRLHAFCLNPEIQSERQEKEGDPRQRRFRSSAKLLGLDNELPRIFVGHNVRKELNSGDLDVVRLRRSIRYVLSHESVNFGLAAIAAFTTIVAPVFLLTENWSIRVLGIIVAPSAAALLMLFRVRSNIK